MAGSPHRIKVMSTDRKAAAMAIPEGFPPGNLLRPGIGKMD
jgi:hypothetical protein